MERFLAWNFYLDYIYEQNNTSFIHSGNVFFTQLQDHQVDYALQIVEPPQEIGNVAQEAKEGGAPGEAGKEAKVVTGRESEETTIPSHDGKLV